MKLLVANCLNLVGFLCLLLGLKCQVPLLKINIQSQIKAVVIYKISHAGKKIKAQAILQGNMVDILNVVYSTTGSAIKAVVLCQKLFATQGGCSVSLF